MRLTGRRMPAAMSMIAALLCGTPAALPAAPPNILFIAVDDLRPQLNCYGRRMMHTPNIDRLAAGGVLFERAYCMVPTCGASRASLMTGVRPTRGRFTSYVTWAERDAPGLTTLNQHLRRSGYTTISLGKVFHHPQDSVDGWSEPPWRSRRPHYQDRQAEQQAIAESKQRYPNTSRHRGPPFEAFDAPDDAYPDGDCAREAISRLQTLAGDPETPFFLAVGFLKPHLPFNAPQRYWDQYDFDTIHLPDNFHPPRNAPEGAVHNSGELRAYAGIPRRGPVSEPTARKLIHGYYACVSFVDAQIGRVLDELDRLGLTESTIVVLWGDHGWQLGEHGMWNKHSCFETSMHAPLIVSAPMADDVEPGSRVRALVEFVDIYPSLCELTGLPAPAHLQGDSFVPLMQDPQQVGKPFAVGRFGRGDTIRSDTLRFSEYTNGKGDVTGSMIYDHRIDADENVNVIADPEYRNPAAELQTELRRQLDRIQQLPAPAANRTDDRR